MEYMESNTKKNSGQAVWQVLASLCLFCMISAQPLLTETMFAGKHYFVSPQGDDETGTGTFEKPWQTIHKALHTIPSAQDDAAIVIRGGTYKIPKTMHFDALRGGSEGKFFTVKSFKDEEVIIDGSLLAGRFSAMASLSSTAYVRLKGLTFANLKGQKSGILIEGNSHHIRIVNNTLRDMTWAEKASDNEQNPKPSDKLSPIAVIGNHPTQAVNNIFIRGNTISNIISGSSGGIKITGNVMGFIVSKNHLSNIANTGIVASGNYPWVIDATGVRIPNKVNHARNGVIQNNVVHDTVSPVANSAGIYLDGARNITVKGNTSYNNAVGFSVGCEQPGDATGNTIRDNLAYDNIGAGLVVGTTHAGAVVNNTSILNNEFRNNNAKGSYGGEMIIRTVNGLVVRNNLFSSRSDLMIVASQPSTNMELNNNLYYGISNNANNAVFDWSGVDRASYIGLQSYQAATCHDLSSIYHDATTVKYFDKIKGNLIIKSGRNAGAKSNELREIKRACYKGTSIW